MILLMMNHLMQVSRELNSISRGVPWKTGKKIWKISLPESTNDLSLAGSDSMSLTPIIVFNPYQGLKNFPSGILDVGYIITQKVEERISSVY